MRITEHQNIKSTPINPPAKRFSTTVVTSLSNIMKSNILLEFRIHTIEFYIKRIVHMF